MKSHAAKRLKELEQENLRLKKAVAELLRTCHSFICREMAKQSEQARE